MKGINISALKWFEAKTFAIQSPGRTLYKGKHTETHTNKTFKVHLTAPTQYSDSRGKVIIYWLKIAFL